MTMYNNEYNNEYIDVDDLFLEGDEEEETDEEYERLLLDELKREFLTNLQLWE
jgi:hypothetical protein